MKNPDKYGLIYHRRERKNKVVNGLKTAGFVLWILLCLAFMVLPVYVVAHFVLKYW